MIRCILAGLALLLPAIAGAADTATTSSTVAGSGELTGGSAMDLGPLWDMLATTNNLIVMVACGVLMELWKRGPVTSEWAKTRWGKLGAYWAPFLWCGLAMFVPIGLAPADASIGQKLMLMIILGYLTSGTYDRFAGSLKHLRGPKEEALVK